MLHVCRFLLQRQEHLGPAAGQSLQQLGLLGPDKQGTLVLLEPHTPTLLAYEKLAAAGVTGAPVLSSDGQIIANLSASDIRWAGWRLLKFDSFYISEIAGCLWV
jgi:5'-AMP-activated protein kinase regulatory gamma subunit